MKQHITIKQWDEITGEQKNILWDNGFKRDWQMSIGQMIEFLGDGWWEDCQVDIADHGFPPEMPPNNLLCDRLWEAVKYKINN